MTPLFANSLLLSLSATLLATAFGVVVALWAAGLEMRWRNWIWAGAVMALVLPPFVVTNCWIALLGETGSWRAGVPLSIYSSGGTIWILALMTWPIAFFFASAAWRRLEGAHLEIEPMLCGTKLVRWLLLPIAKPALVQAALMTAVLCFNNFAVPAILQVKAFPAELWVSFNTSFDYSSALTLSWPLLVAPLLLLLFLRREQISWRWQTGTAEPRVFRRQMGTILFWGSAVAGCAVLALSLALPLAQLCADPDTWRELWPAMAAGRSAVAYSACMATIASAIIVILSLLTWRMPLGGLLWTLLLMPGVLLGIAIIWLFNRPGLEIVYQSATIVLLAYVLRYAALGWNGIARAIRGLDRSLGEAASLEGAGWWQILRHAWWPQVSSHLAAAWYITYLLCLWDVETLVLIVPPGHESLALRIFNLLHYGHNAQVNALCVLLLLLALLPLCLWNGGRCFMSLAQSLARSKSICLASSVLALFMIGCSAEEQGRQSSLQSKLFSHVVLIGQRGTGLGQFNKPRSVTLDRNDNLYVADMTGRVQKFSPDGVFQASWQMPQTDKGKPKGMCRDHAGNIVVIEPHYSRINHFAPDGKKVSAWGVSGTNYGQLAFPRAAAVNSHGEIYVSEYGLVERVQRFSSNGTQCLGTFGAAGTQAGALSRVEGLGIDAQNRVYLADSCNHRIQVFSAEGTFLRTYGRAGAGTGELSYPYDVQIDRAGRQFVCEFGNSRVQIFDSADHPLEILGAAGSAPGEFANPWSLALDSKGNLYVADSLNHRVQKFVRRNASL